MRVNLICISDMELKKKDIQFLLPFRLSIIGPMWVLYKLCKKFVV